MKKSKVSFFFGAGAEIGYGLPSGGKFALDIFRFSKDKDKEELRKQIKSINDLSQIASQWLPDNYSNKRLNMFGKGDFEDIISSSLEHRRHQISNYLDNFDENISNLLCKWKVSESVIRDKFYEITGEQIGDSLYTQAISINEKLSSQVPLFESEYFSAFLRILEVQSDEQYLKRIIRAYLELLVGSLGQSLVYQLNEELFPKAPDKLSVFDDMSGIFRLSYKHVGQTGMEIVIEESPIDINADSEAIDIFRELGRTILEEIYCQTLDYQSLIDNHFRYLYSPKSHWAKFSRIAIFLHTVQRYIIEHVRPDLEKIEKGPGYYHDLIELGSQIELGAIGTTNYNNFVQEIIKDSDVPVYHLNGSVFEYYDPFKNTILCNPTEEQRKDRILVPFMFTQSGIKPLTSVSMSKKYVDLYNHFMESDCICVIGYGFNGDDGHINGMFRSLVEDEEKTLYIFHYKEDEKSEQKLLRDYKNKLRLNSTKNLKIFTVDNNRQVNGLLWYKHVLSKLAENKEIIESIV